MNPTNVGSIEYDAVINTQTLLASSAKADAIAKNTADSMGRSLDKGIINFSNGLSTVFSSVGSGFVSAGHSVTDFGAKVAVTGSMLSSFGSNITQLVRPAALALGAGLGLVSKMAFDQVNSVQQASLALRAYEKNGKKVDKVLSDLLKYARSDLGVLFNRKDLFAAAQNLKIMGDNTSKLTEHVKIMSRSIGLGLSTWEDLSRIVGRVGSTGRLAGDDFDNLTKAGYKLNPSLRNTNITFDKLFKAMDKGIPVDAMKGQADSIKGIGVRLQTAFRGIGESILGVNKDTGKFVEDGAGFALVNFLKQLPVLLKKPEIQQAFKNMGQAISDFSNNALPKIQAFIVFVGSNIGTISKLTFGLLAFGFAMKIVGSVMSSVGTAVKLVGGIITGLGYAIKGVGLAIKGLQLAFAVLAANPVILVIIAVVAIIAGLAFLIIKNWDTLKQWFSTFWNWLLSVTTPVINAIVGAFTTAFNAVKVAITTVWNFLVAAFTAIWNVVSPILNFIKNLFVIVFGSILLVVLYVVGYIKTFLIASWNLIYGVVSTVVSAIGGVISRVFGFIKGVVISVSNSILNFVSGTWNKIYSIISGVVQKIINFFAPAARWLVDKGRAIIQGLINGIKSLAGGVWNAIKAIADPIGRFFSGAGKWLFDVGKNIVQGLIDGMKHMVGAVGNAAGDVGSAVKNKLKGVLGIHSPSTVMMEVGRNITEGLIKGINSGRPMVNMAMQGLAQPAITSSHSIDVSGIDNFTTPATSSQKIEVHNHFEGVMVSSKSDLRIVGERIISSVDDARRAKGLKPINGSAV